MNGYKKETEVIKADNIIIAPAIMHPRLKEQTSVSRRYILS
jgi:hypothetical protein